MTTTGLADWALRAERLAEQLLSEIRSGVDAIPTAEATLTALRIEVGEAPPAEMDGFEFPGEEGCCCPADLLARGGFRGRCPVHGVEEAGQ